MQGKLMKDKIVLIDGYESKITEIGEVGFGIVYLEGPRRGWSDWIVSPHLVNYPIHVAERN